MLALGIVVTAVTGYLLGNINGAILISKWFMKEDVRTRGSGNAGLTNFFRTYGGFNTFLVVLIDAGKTVLACLIGGLLFRRLGYGGLWDTAKMLGGFCSVLGHVFPVFFRFRGGKGILCGGAIACVMNPLIFAVLFSIFLILFFTTHYVSLGSVVAVTLYPFAFWIAFPHNWYVIAMAAGLAVVADFMHRKNIARLVKGTESKVYLKKEK